MLEAAAAIRAVNPNAPVFFYFAVDYTRRWYDLGVWFDEHPGLEVRTYLFCRGEPRGERGRAFVARQQRFLGQMSFSCVVCGARAVKVHNSDGSLATVSQHDDGSNTWHVFDFAQPAAVAKWAGDVANTVTVGKLDGVFIDGYRQRDRWVQGLIPKVHRDAAAGLAGPFTC